jgi:hypothetical protein
MPDLLVPAIIAACALAVVHAVSPAMRFLQGVPRSAWLSIAGGVAVAYVFVHLLPELATGQERVSRAASGLQFHFAERHVYLIALAGLATFYGLQRLAEASKGDKPPTGNDVAASDGTRGRAMASDPEQSTSATVFWIHMASFGLYNGLIGYLLLHLEKRTLAGLVFFGVAMALHFVVTDFGLNEDHKVRFQRIGRWVLIVAVFLGLFVGYETEISDVAVSVLIAFLAGGVILNTLKEEVPTERRSRFWAFALGMAGYAALLLTL